MDSTDGGSAPSELSTTSFVTFYPLEVRIGKAVFPGVQPVDVRFGIVVFSRLPGHSVLRKCGVLSDEFYFIVLSPDGLDIQISSRFANVALCYISEAAMGEQKGDDLRSVVLYLLGPPQFACFAKQWSGPADNRKNDHWVHCCDITRGEAIRSRVVRITCTKAEAEGFLDMFQKFKLREPLSDQDTLIPFDEQLFWHASSERAESAADGTTGDVRQVQSAPGSSVVAAVATSSSGGQKRAVSVAEAPPLPPERPAKRSRSSADKRAVPDAALPALPSEVWMLIFSFFGAVDVCRAAQVCTQFAALSNEPQLWQRICARFRVPEPMPLPLEAGQRRPRKSVVSDAAPDDAALAARWRHTYKVLSRIRCVDCGAKAFPQKCIGAKLLGIVLCETCCRKDVYATISMSDLQYAFKSLPRPVVSVARHFTTRRTRNVYMRLFLRADLAKLASDAEAVASIARRKPKNASHKGFVDCVCCAES